MTGLEILYLIGGLSAVAGFLALVRRAGARSIEDGGRGIRDRLRGADEPDAPDTPAADVAPAPDPDDDEDEDENTAAALREGLAKTRGGFVATLGRLFSKKKIDSDTLAELEEVLLTADIGPRTANRLFQAIKNDLTREQLADPAAIWARIREESATILSVNAAPLTFEGKRPFVLLTIGVNGVGKTTTIGKLAARLTAEGRRVLLAAGDTFRAAAVEQLEIWAERASAPIVKGKANSDPASVIFDAIRQGIEGDYDVVIADTAGRLHTKSELMDELQKVRRVCDKALAGAPHEVWLVLDSTNGQNAIQQAILFKQAMDVTGIVLTKLDGTAKGGVILGICDELQVPVRYIGVGEGVDDLRPFHVQAFVDALYAQDNQPAN